jgi:hypothetical protein
LSRYGYTKDINLDIDKKGKGKKLKKDIQIKLGEEELDLGPRFEKKSTTIDSDITKTRMLNLPN